MSRGMIKPAKWQVQPAKTQISLGWSQSSLSAWRKLGSLATHWAHSENSDQTGQMPRLIWVFAWHTVILLVLSRGSSNVLMQQWISNLLDLDLTFCAGDLAGSVVCVSVFDKVSSVVSDSFSSAIVFSSVLIIISLTVSTGTLCLVETATSFINWQPVYLHV